MTVNSEVNAVEYAGNGVTVIFPVPFYFLEASHLRVRSIAADGTVTTLALTSDYTVAGAGALAGGSITAIVPPASGTTLEITRDVPITQLTDYVPNDPFPAESHERALDKLTMICQQLNSEAADALARTVRVPAPETINEAPRLADRALKYFVWNGSGHPDVADAGLGDIIGTMATFPDRAAVMAADINTLVTKVIFVGGYANYADGGHGFYKLVNTSSWADGEVVDAGGHIWQLMLEQGRLYATQLGVVPDGNFLGTTGTANDDAIDRVIAAPARLVIWPCGGIRFLQTHYPRADQFWVGQLPDLGPNNPDASTMPSGTTFIYAGSGNRAAFWGEGPTSIWSNNLWKDFGVMTGHPNGVDGANGTDCEWLFYAYHARGTRWDTIHWRHRGGSFGTIPAESVEGSFGCVRLDGKLSGATWYHEFKANEFLTACSRSHGAMGDTLNYQGYAWGADLEGNDIFLEGCHFNNSSVRGRNGGQIHVSSCNLENGDWGSGNWASPATGRAAIVCTSEALSKGATGNQPKGLSLFFSGSSKISQYTYAIVMDASYFTGTTECGLAGTVGSFRRNREAELLLIQNPDGTCGGGALSTLNNTTRDENEPDDVDAPGIGKAAPLRIRALASDKSSPGNWSGLRITNNNVLYPEAWDDMRHVTAAWWPRYNSTTVEMRGVAPAAVSDNPGGETDATESTAAITGSSFGAGWPSVTRTSANTGDNAAVFRASEYVCVRGAVAEVGGYFARFIWSCPSVVAGDRAFVGLLSNTSQIPAATEPTALTQVFGVGFDAADPRNWHFISGDGTNRKHVDLGSEFPVDDTAAVWELLQWTEGFNDNIVFMMMRLDAPGPRVYQSYPVNQGPSGGQRLCPHFWRARATALAAGSVAVRLYKFECRTQPFDWLGSRLRTVR